jgi:thiamine biosynthesis lipoprotein
MRPASHSALVFGLAAMGAAEPDLSNSGPALAPPEHLAREIRIVMGTALEIAIFHADSVVAQTSLDAAFAEAMRLEDLLSHYRPETPLSKLNAASGKPVETDPELVAYLERARSDAERTEGSFDVTVAPLLALHRRGTPEAAEIRRTLELVGAGKIRILGVRRVALAPGMAIDPGGDGKGLAIDRMVELLRSKGVERAFLNFGGSSIYGMGSPPSRPSSLRWEPPSALDLLGVDLPGAGTSLSLDSAAAEGWFVPIQDPEGRPLDAVFLRDESLSVSSALPPAPQEDARAGHIVDPRTGELVLLERTSAVISRSATDGDVLSTALIVEGARGLRFLARFDGAEAVVFESGGRTSSPGWPSLSVSAGGEP